MENSNLQILLQEAMKDDYEKKFDSFEELSEFANAVEKNAEWIVIPTNSIMAEATTDVCDDFEDAKLLQDTDKNTGLVLNLIGTQYCVGLSTLSTLFPRAGISGPALSKVSKKELAEILNYCVQTRKGDSKIRIDTGKIRAVHSGDEHDYAELAVPNLLRAARQEISSYKDNCTFVRGSWSHYICSAIWDIHDKEICEHYAKLFKSMDLEIDEKDIKTCLVFQTSDVAVCGANVNYMIQAKNTSLALNGAIKLNHKGKASVMDFKSNMNMAFSGFKAAFEDIEKLKDIEINYPEDCIINMAKKVELPLKAARKAAEHYYEIFGSKKANALMVYTIGLNHIVDILKTESNKRMSERTLLDYQEKIARCILMNFKDYDYMRKVD
ncbi:hypothetical protein N5B56_01175 [Eubacterium sp. LFL-14]|uniref:Uncharacterized protein n=1 Tax=Eubacterium album TaxID=2978477 RepID=A0ABT2LYJ6_9FIRM|nr:hypothetical protein [Eubacterium sp. LFL-14]MCT7397696.1 hypothetical protein [Eubacterium sp. LFL-14]